MKKLTAAIALVVLLTASPAAASPPPPTVTYAAVQYVGTSYAYTISNVNCDIPPCTAAARWYRSTSPDRLGTSMFRGFTGNYAFTAADLRSGPRVVATVYNSGTTNGKASTTVYITLLAAPPPTAI